MLLRVLLFLFFTISCTRLEVPKSEEERMLYMMGQVQADSLSHLKLNERELDVYLAGMKAQYIKRFPKEMSQFNYQDYGPNMDRYELRRLNQLAEVEKKEGSKLVDELKASGGKVLSSGLTYKILIMGNGKRASNNDKVELHLHQSLRDKTVFYSTVDAGQKQIFRMNSLIPGLQAALQLIGEGGEVQVVLPSDLAYGDRGLPPTIPGGASILAYVKFFRIVP